MCTNLTVVNSTNTDHSRGATASALSSILELDPDRPAWERLDDPDAAVVSHSSAAALYGVGDLRADIHEFTVPRRQQTRRRDVRLRRGVVPENGRFLLHGLPTTRAGWMVADLLADSVDPDQVAQIAAEVIANVYDYPRGVAESLAPHAAKFGFRKGDWIALLDGLLRRTGYAEREQMIAMARQS